MYGKSEILASEVIRRFFGFCELESDIFEFVLNYDVIETFRQCMNKSGFRKIFSDLN